jgi:hypothetical protein
MNQIAEKNRAYEASDTVSPGARGAAAPRPFAKLASGRDGRSLTCRDLLLLLHADFALFQPGAVCDRHAAVTNG